MVKRKIQKANEEIEIDDSETVETENLQEIETKYNQLINEIKPKLLTKAQLKQGGSGIRSKHAQEKGYEVVMNEINELGKKLGKALIGLGNLRG